MNERNGRESLCDIPIRWIRPVGTGSTRHRRVCQQATFGCVLLRGGSELEHFALQVEPEFKSWGYATSLSLTDRSEAQQMVVRLVTATVRECE